MILIGGDIIYCVCGKEASNSTVNANAVAIVFQGRAFSTVHKRTIIKFTESSISLIKLY